MCPSRMIYTVRPCLIHTRHAMPFFSRPQHSTAVERRPCCGLEKNGMAGAWHGYGMTSVNQKRPHCVNQMGNTHSKPFAARHANGMLCVNRPLVGNLRHIMTNFGSVHVACSYLYQIWTKTELDKELSVYQDAQKSSRKYFYW